MRIGLATSTAVAPSDQDEHLLAAALAGQGAAPVIVDWRDPAVDWAGFDAVVIRSTWDYTADVERFVAWARRVEAAGTLLLNDAEVVRWNTHKGYLIELEERGAPIVPTAWLAAGDSVDLAALAESRGWDGVVAKPAVGAGAEGLLVVAPGEDPAASQEAFAALTSAGDTLVQPFVRSVTTDGELSVVVIDGVASHAVRKRPAAGELRTQIEFGATYTGVDAPAAARALAAWVVEATGHDLLYARVDLLADEDGSWMLGELECVEPALYLQWSSDGAARLATAVRARADGP